MRSFSTVAAVLILICVAAVAQGTAPPAAGTTPNATHKKPKVISNEDLDALPGGISVVGAHDSWKDQPAGDGEQPASEPSAKPPLPEKPKEHCASRGFAEAVAITLRQEGIGWRAPFWMDRIFGSDVCLPKLNGVEALARRVEGDYTLPTGEKLHIASRTSGLPSSEELVLNTEADKHYVVLWKGVPYVTTSVRYMQQMVSDGASTGKAGVVVSGLDLYDPENDRNVVFDVKAGDSPDSIEAVVFFTITPRQ